MAYVNSYSKGGIYLSIDTSNSTDNTFTVTFPNSYTTFNSSCNKNNDTYDLNLYTSITSSHEIKDILNMPLEDLPLHINDKYTELAKKVLALRLKAET